MKIINQCGRSMVEMLGVLAIIGVLSVGGIAGYQKAMFKYKLNKQAEAMNLLIINAMDLLKSIVIVNQDTYSTYTEMFQKLNLIPNGFNKSDSTYLRDMFDNNIWIFSKTDSAPYTYGIGYALRSGDKDDICQNLLLVSKGFSKELHYISTDKTATLDSDQETIYVAYGDQFCNNDKKKCISHLNLDEIEKACNQCDEIKRCRFYFIWK